ncbi:MAG: hypothetical protein A2Y21_02890 [Clostridiales bacterium GWC2_40_7]|nr:MAG: hypothetical protein A2Y21_02890 [Clostridiales bacterium GWC2_40_7]
MQLQGLMFMLFILLIIPVMALSTNHLIFFAIMAIILIITSIKSIYARFFDIESQEEDDDSDEDAEEEFEDLLNLDMKKFGTGIYIVKDLFIILFFVYCSFYLKSILLKVDAALLILIQIHHIKSVLNRNGLKKKEVNLSDRNLATISGILSLLLIVFTSFNLIFGQSF